MESIGHVKNSFNIHMINTLMIKNALIILCLLLFPVDSYAEHVEIPTAKINTDNAFLCKEKLAIERIAFQAAAFLLRAVGKSEYPSIILDDCNHKFIIKQNIKFYKDKNFSDAPEAIKKYFYECFLINSLLLKNNSDKNLKEFNEKRKELKNNLNEYLSQYGMEWDNIIFEATGKTGSDLMYPFIKKNFSKYSLERVNMNDPAIMEKVIKQSYVDLADFLDAESLKLIKK